MPAIPSNATVPSRLRARRRTLGRWAMAGGLVALLFADAAAGPTTTVALENLVGTSTPPSAALLDADGVTPLSAGTTVAGDGAVIALGYFTGATSAATFTGEWVPLTGPQGANIPWQRTSVGDSSAGGGTPDGFFTLQTDFDSANSAVFQRIPPVGTRLSIAIYNRGTIGGSTHFNIATHDDWRWEVPTGPLPLPAIYLNPAVQGALWLGGSGTALRTALATATFPGNAARAPARLVNISTRGFVGDGAAQMIPGFYLQGTGSSRLLVRAVGPTLGLPPDQGGFGVTGALADPQLTIMRQLDGAAVAHNDDWSNQADPGAVAAAIASTFAFPIPSGSLDAALLAELPVSPGGYTVLVAGKSGATGVAIAEVYLSDASPTAPAELVNISTRGFVGTGSNVMIPGFVLGPGGPRRLLIRAVGPTLGAPSLQGGFGVPDTLADPLIEVVSSAAPSQVLASNNDWGNAGQTAAIEAAAAQVGAFGLIRGSRDAALILQLPGSEQSRGFTVQVSGAGGTTGLVITEIYELP